MAKKKDDKFLVTQKGLDELKEELEELEKVKRPKAVDRLQSAREMGDLTENGEYMSARQDLEFLDEQIEEIKEKLRHAKVVVKSKTKKTVGIGSKVTLFVGKKKVVYTVVGEGEADPAENKISHKSPLGEAILGKKVGDSGHAQVPVGKLKYTIKKIE